MMSSAHRKPVARLEIIARRTHGNRYASGADANLKRLFDGKDVLPQTREWPIDFAGRDSDGGRWHNPFPRPSRRSRVTDAAGRLSSMRSRHNRPRRPGALWLFSLSAPAPPGATRPI